MVFVKKCIFTDRQIYAFDTLILSQRVQHQPFGVFDKIMGYLTSFRDKHHIISFKTHYHVRQLGIESFIEMKLIL